MLMIIFCAAFVFTIARCTGDRSFVTKTVCVGEDVTLTCSRQAESAGYLFWVKLVVGNFPEVLGATYTFDNANVNKTPRITVKQEPGTYVLHITKTQLSDTAFYYCEEVLELKTTFLNKTFLSVKGPEPDITAVTQDFQSNPVRPGVSVTLQCSVLSDPENKTCPGDHSVFWFRSGSAERRPSLIYAHGNKGDAQCEKSPEAGSPQECVYNFSKNVGSSDAGTYYCAVASCGEIFYGNGTKLEIETSNLLFGDCQRTNTLLCLLCAALAISLTVIALLIYTIKKNSHDAAAAALQPHVATTTADQQSQQIDEDSLVYSVPNFTRWKHGSSVRKGASAVEGETIYSDVRVVG